MKSLSVLFFLWLIHFSNAHGLSFSEPNFLADSLYATKSDQTYKLRSQRLIAPAVFISFGVISLESEALKRLNYSTRYEIGEHQPKHITLDNYTQYAPAALVYGLNALGVQGKHNFRDRTLIYASSQLLVAAMVVPIKHIAKEERPDGSNGLSFPSGHTATAFSSAQFMYREYKDSNFLLSLSGYSFAVFTGIYRTINNKHWVGDVVAGAGFGILSTELAYFLYPKVNRMLLSKEGKNSAILLPYYQKDMMGVSWVKKI